jgi:formylglycine-generating enzyme required for sulfatase activity
MLIYKYSYQQFPLYAILQLLILRCAEDLYTMKYLWLLLMIGFCSFTQLSSNEDQTQSGTLIVTYHTGPSAERLNRIHFWLINERGERRLYPHGNAFVDDGDQNVRMVLIENLPKGDYELQFLIPNKDRYFESIDDKRIAISGGGVVKIDQAIKPIDNPQITSNDIAALDIDVYYERPESEIILPKTGKRYYSYPSTEVDYPEANITVRSTLPRARWTLFQANETIVTGEGSLSHVLVIPGLDYYMEAEQFDDYTLKIYPPDTFNLRDRQTTTVDLVYKRKYGYINIETPLPNGEELSLFIEGDPNKGPIRTTATASNNTLSWKSGSLPAGLYNVTITPPDYYHPVEPFTVEVKKGQSTVIRPNLEGARWIKVTSNSPDAIYLLRDQNRKNAWKGEGTEHTFEGLIPGTYSLTFASTSPQKAIPPANERVVLSRYRDDSATVVADYDIAGQLEIESNLDRYHVRIASMSKQGKPHREIVRNYKKTVYLPTGEYRVSFLPTKEMAHFEVPKPIEVNVRAYQTAEAYGSYPTFQKSFDAIEDDSRNLGEVEVEEPPRIPLDATATLNTVTSGDMIFGDPFNDQKTNELSPRKVFLNSFEISTFEITNKQFAHWLTDASKKGTVLYHENGTRSGIVTNLKGQILFQTNTANKHSQIFATKLSNETIDFSPLPGKDEHPVIFVTWYGADQFCKDHQCRLPTEAEWEKAGGMAITASKQSLKKYRYGFSRNTIRRPWANYKENNQPIENFRVKTTPVGFYDGKNLLPLEVGDSEQTRTRHAQSPTGLYDMSGNVWEWTNDWFADANQVPNEQDNPQGPSIGIKNVVKGGCYDSLNEGVRIAERMGIPRDYCDEFTGFRIARNK